MLLKLSLTGIRSRLKDYIVLFSGLTIASAIFYMFLSLATNEKFLETNTMVDGTPIIFGFGIFLLAIITFVYILYANNFLMSMRQRDYGMFMMLGAKSSKIGTLIFIETFLLGVIATAIGVVLGIGLTQLVAGLLIDNLGLTIHHFVGLYLPAIFWTFAFFTILFFLAASRNRLKLISTPILELLRGEQKPTSNRRSKISLVVEAVAGIILLAIGYWSMINVRILMLAAIPVALVTIVAGSYFVFNSFFIAVIDLMKKSKSYLYKGIRSFTLNQLRFRIKDYTRILSVVSILFALALGAITVGIGFKGETGLMSQSIYYDAQVYVKDAKINQQLSKLAIQTQDSYSYKLSGKNLYVNRDELLKKPLKANRVQDSHGQFTGIKTYTYNQAKDYGDRGEATPYVGQLFPVGPNGKTLKIVDAATYAKISATPKTLSLIKTKDFIKDKDTLLKIDKLQKEADPKLGQNDWLFSNSKAMYYQQVNGLYSGFEFMGFFLGIAFLTMLASTLMFKILSGAQSDIKRYEMLAKIGVRQKLLRHSIAKELGVLFALPAGLGIIHVLFGLQFFTALMTNPYRAIWVPFGIFLVLYLIYYLITYWLYKGIVLYKEK